MTDLNTKKKLLAAAERLTMSGHQEFTGFELAKESAQRDGHEVFLGVAILMGPGRLYSTLKMLERESNMTSRWEDSDTRPRRRYYRLLCTFDHGVTSGYRGLRCPKCRAYIPEYK